MIFDIITSCVELTYGAGPATVPLMPGNIPRACIANVLVVIMDTPEWRGSS